MLRSIFVLLTLALVAPPVRAQQPQEKSPPQKASSDSAEANPIEDALRRYGAAFNANDAAALAALWAPQGLYANRSTGERTAGREALHKDFQELFEESPGVRLAGRLNDVRMIKPDVAAADGHVTVVFPTGEAVETGFSAIYIKEGDAWLLESIHESELPSPETPYDALAELEWMVGHWVDQTDAAQVNTVVRWSPSRAFLIRSFSAQLEGEAPMEGTQVIGWDPSQKQIRSWTFNSDGSFGEATWSKSDADWIVKATQTLADGRLASGTQVITRVDDNTLSVELLGRTIDGEPAPSTDPITVVRADAPPAEEAAPAAEPAPANAAAPAAQPRQPAAPRAPAATNPPAPTTKKPATTKKQGAQP